MNPLTVQITLEDMRQIAGTLMTLHGDGALTVADDVMGELITEGHAECADAWRALRSVMEEVVAGRLSLEEQLTVH